MNLTGKLLLASAIVASASLQAATTYNLDFNSQSNSPGLIYDGSFAISPYTGTVGGTTVKLFCDDFNDNITWGQQNITAYSTALTASATTLDQQTRYGDANPSTAGAGYPAGTQLYDEMAWLATQMMATSGGNATNNDIAIQEAIWTLTGDKNVNDGANLPHSQTTTGTGTLGDAGAQQSYLAWIADAAADYNSSTVGYASLVTGNWTIVTAQASAGCTVGSGTVNSYMGVSACTPGTAGTGTVTQEFLSYTGGVPVITTGNLPGTPEPASFILIGSGLIAGAIFGRRKATSKA